MDVSEAATGECHTSGDIVHMTAAQHLGKYQPLLHQERFQECDRKRCAQANAPGREQCSLCLNCHAPCLPACFLTPLPRFLPSPYVSRAIAIGQDGDRNIANSLLFQPSSGEAHQHSDLRALWHWPDQGVGGGCSLAGELGQQLPRRLMGAGGGGGAGGMCGRNRVAIKRRLHCRGSGREIVPSWGDQKPEARGTLKIMGLLKGERFRLCLKSNGAHIRSLRGSDMITCALTCHHGKQCLTGTLLF